MALSPTQYGEGFWKGWVHGLALEDVVPLCGDREGEPPPILPRNHLLFTDAIVRNDVFPKTDKRKRGEIISLSLSLSLFFLEYKVYLRQSFS